MIRLLATITLAGVCYGQEVNEDYACKAVVALESGAEWIGPGSVRGSWSVGAFHEVSHWQFTPALIAQYKLSVRRMATDTMYAERAFRIYFRSLIRRTGSVRNAMAAFHRGLGGIKKKAAQEYATRALDLISSYQQEDNHGP